MCEEVSGSADGVFGRAPFFSVSLMKSPAVEPFPPGNPPTAFLSKLSLLFSPHTPERAHAEITKGQAETNRQNQPREFSVSGLVLHVLAIERDSADGCQNKENKARNFQPQLVQNSAEGTQ